VPPSPSGGAGGDGRASPLPALLAPRSAHQDRRLIRRMALMQGAIEVGRAAGMRWRRPVRNERTPLFSAQPGEHALVANPARSKHSGSPLNANVVWAPLRGVVLALLAAAWLIPSAAAGATGHTSCLL
jgi:hypothetical protein